MILVDTSVWTDHFRKINKELVSLLDQGQVVTHPAIIGELMLGNLKKREALRQYLLGLETAKTASDQEVLDFIESQKIHGLGIGFVDVHLLVSVKLSSSKLWTMDRHLHSVAEKLGVVP